MKLRSRWPLTVLAVLIMAVAVVLAVGPHLFTSLAQPAPTGAKAKASTSASKQSAKASTNSTEKPSTGNAGEAASKASQPGASTPPGTGMMLAGGGPLPGQGAQVVKSPGQTQVKFPAVEVVVDGKPVVTVPSQQVAESVLKQLRDDYVSKLDAAGNKSQIDSVKMVSDIQYQPVQVLPSKIDTPDQALYVLTKGTTKKVTYTVQRGDSLWTIARKRDTSVDKLRQANPPLQQSNTLQPGEQLSLVVPNPPVKFQSSQTVVVDQKIKYDTKTVYDPKLFKWEQVVRQDGKDGIQRVTETVVRTNLKITDVKILNSQVIQKPQTMVIARGDRKVPSHGSGSFIWPVQGRVTSGFGWRWHHTNFHPGVDIGVPIGTPVHAADAGTVILARWDGGCGRAVEINHGNGVVSKYCHLSKILVKHGQHVNKAQVIGKSGDSGFSTGPHLHFQINIDGTPVNPIKIFQQQNQ